MPCIFAVAIISKQNMKYSLKISKERSVHFQISNPPFKSAVPLSEKPIFVHNICSIIDIEHRFQKCNTFETVNTIKECCFASYHCTTEYCPVWPKKPVKKQHSGKTELLLFDMCPRPLGRSVQPSFRQFLFREMFQYNPTKMLLFDQIFHSYQGGVAQIQRQILQGRPYSFKRVLHAHNIPYVSLCAFCRVVVPTKPFTNTALYYKMLLESEPTPLATKCFGGFDG